MADLAVQKKQGIATFLGSEKVKENIENVVGKAETQTFISSIVSAVQTNPDLSKCTNSSIMSVGLLIHSLKLPPSPQLGYAFFVPYKNKSGEFEAQFQISYKGMIQLAIRSGQYKKINVSDIKEGEITKYDPINDEYEFNAINDPTARNEAKVIGYYAFFETVNGYRKGLYMTREELLAHAEKYSAMYRSDIKYGNKKSMWSTSEPQMCKKTVMKALLSKYGIMSVEMQNAITKDQAVINEDGSPDYVDNKEEEYIPTNPHADVVVADAEVVTDAEVVEEVKEE